MKKIFILCDIIHVDVGGLAKIVLDRSRLFHEKGYDVTILTIEAGKDYRIISQELKDKGLLHPALNIINIYNYYEENYTRQSLIKKIFSRIKYYGKLSRVNELGYKIIDEYDDKRVVRYLRSKRYAMLKKWGDGGSLLYIEYFKENGGLKKRVYFLHGFKTKEVFFYADRIKQIKYYTPDGFCYLLELFNNQMQKKDILLFDRKNDVLTFKNEHDFHKHFISEICANSKEKPFLICDGSGPTPRISNIDSNLAYKISQLHSNPYTKPYSYGSPMRNVGILDGKFKKVDAFITLTERQKTDILKEFGNYDNIHVIPNLVPYKEKSDFEKDPNKITMFIRYSPEKNLEDAIKAFRIVVKERENATLELFGRVGSVPGEIKEFKKVKGLIKKYQLEKNVILRDFTNNVDSEMAISVATLLTSEFEGFPLVILESMVNSTPVISYDINYGPSDVIDHGINGFLVQNGNIRQMANYIIRLIDDNRKATRMGEAAREKILENYSPNVVINQWEDLFDTITKKTN